MGILRVSVPNLDEDNVILTYIMVDGEGQREIINRDELFYVVVPISYGTDLHLGPTYFKGDSDINEATTTRRKMDITGAKIALLRHSSPDSVLLSTGCVLPDVDRISRHCTTLQRVVPVLSSHVDGMAGYICPREEISPTLYLDDRVLEVM